MAKIRKLFLKLTCCSSLTREQRKQEKRTIVFSEAFDDFVAHRCTIKSAYYTMYKTFSKEFTEHVNAKYGIESIVINRQSLDGFLQHKYPDVFIHDDYIFGIKIWFFDK